MAILKKTPKLNLEPEYSAGFVCNKYDVNNGDATKAFWFCVDIVRDFWPDIVPLTQDLMFIVHDRAAANRVKLTQCPERCYSSGIEGIFLLDGHAVTITVKASDILLGLLKNRDAVYVELTHAC